MFEGYYKKSRSERLQILRDYADLTDAELAILDHEGRSLLRRRTIWWKI